MERKQTHMMYGLFTAIASIIVGLVLHFTNLSFEPWAQWVTHAVLLVGIILNDIAFSKENDANVTFGQVFSSGFKTTAIYTLIIIVWSFISLLIFPDIMEKGMQIAEEKMMSQGLPDEQITQALEMTRNNFKLFMVGGILFMTMFWGAIFSLLGAAIAKKKPNAAPPAQMQ